MTIKSMLTGALLVGARGSPCSLEAAAAPGASSASEPSASSLAFPRQLMLRQRFSSEAPWPLTVSQENGQDDQRVGFTGRFARQLAETAPN